jgi:hypothetical protein
MTLREADKLGTDTEAGTLACRNTNRGGEEVEDGEDNGGEDREGRDLRHIELTLGDDDGRDGDGETLNEILDHTSDDVRNHGIHLLITVV